ncbi:MAG TPA: hypothetical protein VF844_19275 [Ktedonobacteraceae bacterium]
MQISSRTRPHGGRRKAHSHSWQFWASTLLLLPLVAVYLCRAPAAHAAGGGPIIHWDSSMIYAGQNNGFPWGPVGENTIVHGANFSSNQQLRLIVVPGDSNNSGAVCRQTGVTVATVKTSTSGTFDQNFLWPASAGRVNQGYSICSILVADGSLASRFDDGPFTVLTANPPAIDISSNSVQAGGNVTVTGHNWVPPQQVSINIAGCAACEPGSSEVTNASTTSTGLNDGSFSIAVTIPASTKPGSYVVDALTSTGLEAFYTTGVKHLTITAAPITSPPTVNPTPTNSPAATATATPAATMTATTTSSGTTDNTSSGTTDNGGKNNTLLIIVLIAIALVLFAIAGVIIFIPMLRSRSRAAPTKPAQYMQHMQQNGSAPNFGQPQATPPGWPPSNFNQPTQRQGSFTPMPPGGPYNNYGQGSLCMNCGSPLPPNTMVCNVCGIQQAAIPGPTRSDWVQ